jgi:hypothetical protein
MDSSRFDAVSKLFAARRVSRRQALKDVGAGVAAVGLASTGIANVSAQDATPAAGSPPEEPSLLFVQSFQTGSIAPKAGEDGTYTVSLERGLGQTIYFADRPDRAVGAFPTDAFLGWLGFTPDDPPNAALLVDKGSGETDFAVVELFNPVYDTANHNLTYDVQVLEDWEQSVEISFQEEPADLAALAASFGAAHLFIDGIADCPSQDMVCYTSAGTAGTIPDSDHDGFCYSLAQFICVPCNPWVYGINGPNDMKDYWVDQCNSRFDACNGDCSLQGFCSRDAPLGNTLCIPML